MINQNFYICKSLNLNKFWMIESNELIFWPQMHFEFYVLYVLGSILTWNFMELTYKSKGIEPDSMAGMLQGLKI